MSAAEARFAVVGNPGSRRVELFRAAVAAAGAPEPAVLAWRDVLRGEPGAVPEPGTFVLLGTGVVAILGVSYRRRRRLP